MPWLCIYSVESRKDKEEPGVSWPWTASVLLRVNPRLFEELPSQRPAHSLITFRHFWLAVGVRTASPPGETRRGNRG